VPGDSPLLLEPVLRRHPKLRIYVVHRGSPLLDQMIRDDVGLQCGGQGGRESQSRRPATPSAAATLYRSLCVHIRSHDFRAVADRRESPSF
jgi:predicted TIM-barrel fold metal-dependent hydrolase